LNAVHGGEMQLSKAVWEPYFLETRGWDWASVVNDPVRHYCAAYEVFQRSSGWGPWPGCKP
jgi:hypothetical protein